MLNDKVKTLIGFAKKSGNLVSGEQSCRIEVKKKPSLIIVASDASENTKKIFQNKSKYYDVPLIYKSTKDEIGRVIGSPSRAVIIIKDKNLATKILEIIENDAT
ncbi:ribosomal L7Ae/L30e/S12e/Gadd45 family protein [Serpentinicella sp. ANB-PHB4]|uniref:L7Ae/L30e/S12e/Gadd45 family ribosomal protein n=1 Tax=Serpentinicella sp. ANB-PHB4 TaxID=3074076 RepID=UPI0028678C8C|nr:ribosomal L7Ae/L30e/S12e/Gadd45 family protein [Serpentinicella sp. ANB-PHB4]MDR5658221.1 ribosomal L7Ae/L30e/S12e/Gadd45 family protein [Serpentinicella sp. ANB-PHB4]